MGATGPTGAAGSTGPAGPPCPAGPTPVVTVGTTTTVDPGTPASVTSTATADGVRLDFAIPRGAPAELPDDSFASFATYGVQFTNASQIPMGTVVADTTNQIALENSTRISLEPGYYHISYHVSALMATEGYMQITPYYNGASHIEFGIYEKTGAGRTTAYGSNSLIIDVPSSTLFSLTYNSNVTSTDGAMTVTVIKLRRN